MIYFSDITRFLYKKRLTFLALFLLFSLAAFLIALFVTPLRFCAQASFHQGQNQIEEGSLQTVLKTLSLNPQNTSAHPFMRSRKILSDVVRECGLQVVPQRDDRLRTLVLTEFNLANEQPDLAFKNVIYDNEYETTFYIVPLSAQTFEVWDQRKISIGKGALHEPFDFKQGQWTLTHMKHLEGPLKCKMVSLRRATALLRKNLKIKQTRGEPHLLSLTLGHPFRQTALSSLNCVMHKYQSFLKQEHEEVVTSQMRYLNKRLEQMGRDYDHALQQHVTYLQETMGVEGFLGLAQEIEMLQEPKEKYTAKKHELDLAHKRWQEPKDFVAAADHPWKEGRGKIDSLLWEKEQLGSGLIPDDDLKGIDLETAHILNTDYIKELDATTTEITRLESALDALAKPSFEMSALSQFLHDEVSQGLIQKGAEYALALSDKDNRTAKELARLQESLLRQKRFLREHIDQKKELLKTRAQLVEQKIYSLKRKALGLIEKEKSYTEDKLAEIAQKMNSLPEKWRLESRLKLKKELLLQIIEGLTQLSESKVLKRHLYHVASKPLDLADAPFTLASSHLFLIALFGGVMGTFFSFFALLFKTSYQGLPLSYGYLQDQKWPLLDREDEVAKIALRTAHKKVVVVVGKPIGDELVQFWQGMGKKACSISLTFPFAPPLENYDHIVIEILKPASSPEALFSLQWGDFFVLYLKEEKRENLIPFRERDVLCQLSN